MVAEAPSPCVDAVLLSPTALMVAPRPTARPAFPVPSRSTVALSPLASALESLFVAMADPRDFFVSEDIQLRTGLDRQAG